MTPAFKYSIGAYLKAQPALANTAATGGAPITTGGPVDRSSGFAGSAALLISGAYTVASGAAGDYLTVSGVVNTASSLSGGALAAPSALKSFSVQVPWASNAAGKSFCVSIPVTLAAAQQYVALSSVTLTPTSAGGSYSAMSVNATWVLAGESQTPSPAFAQSGFVSYSN